MEWLHCIFILLTASRIECNFLIEREIHREILRDYYTDVRPNLYTNSPVRVHFDMKLQRLVGYDVKRQVLTVTAFTLLRWEDPQLAWNKTKYNGTDWINMDRIKIWTPDIVLYNTALDQSVTHTDIYKTKVRIKSDGNVIWNPPVTWEISCASDVTWFPVDKQSCIFYFGSWSYTKYQLKVVFYNKPTAKESLYSDQFLVESGEWELISIESYEEDLSFNCCPEPFSTIGYSIVMRRLSLYYFIYIILPLMSLSFLFLIVFHIPPDNGERMGFGVTVLLSITVYLLVISEKLPEKSDSKPLLGLCFIIIFYILCIALALAAMTTVLPKRKKKPPNFLKSLIYTGVRCCRKSSTTVTPTPRKVQPISMTERVQKNFDANTYNDIDDDDDQKDYSDEWTQICRYLDKRFTMMFAFLLIVLPFLTIVSLPSDGKA